MNLSTFTKRAELGQEYWIDLWNNETLDRRIKNFENVKSISFEVSSNNGRLIKI